MLNSAIQHMRKIYSIFLLPWGWLYGVIMQVRNSLYDRGIQKTYAFDTAVISVGNLTVGGTGKTPCIEYLVRLLKEQLSIAVLSRGYKRTTQGFRVGNSYDTVLTIGDEPFQLYSKFASSGRVRIAVAEDRVQGISKLLDIAPGTQAILLDDGFQHRSVKPRLNILLTDFHWPFFADYILPTGRLREPRQSAHRADVVVVTKCPDSIPKATQQYFQHHIRKYCRNQPPLPIFFTRICYGSPIRVGGKRTNFFAEYVLLVTGIADPAPLVRYVAQHYRLIQHMAFKDHHAFTPQDIQKILSVFDCMEYKKKCLLTTEKDSVRLLHTSLQSMLQHIPVFYLPIAMKFVEGEEVFNQLIFDIIQQY